MPEDEGIEFSYPYHHPYEIRSGTVGEPLETRAIYEVVNTQTGHVEDRQAVLGNAIRAARIFAALLKEELEETQSVEWPEEE